MTPLPNIATMPAADVRCEIAERLGWKFVKTTASLDPAGEWNRLPHWHYDLNAAWGLWEPMGVERHLSSHSGMCYTAIEWIDDDVERGTAQQDPHPALAICRAALAYLRETKP